MKLRLVPAKQGAQWVRSGFQIVLRRPLAYASLFSIFLFGLTALMLLPGIGVMLVLIALPLVTQAFIVATQRALLNKPISPNVFLEPLRAGRPQAFSMIRLGLVYATITLLVIAISGWADSGAVEAFEKAVLSGKPDVKQIEEMAADPRLAIGLLLRLSFASLISLPFWYAPALVHWGNQNWIKSLFFSTVACWHNRAAFTVYGLTWGVVIATFGLLVNIFFLFLNQPQLIGLVALPASLVFSTVFYASLYFTFADCFEENSKKQM